MVTATGLSCRLQMKLPTEKRWPLDIESVDGDRFRVGGRRVVIKFLIPNTLKVDISDIESVESGSRKIIESRRKHVSWESNPPNTWQWSYPRQDVLWEVCLVLKTKKRLRRAARSKCTTRVHGNLRRMKKRYMPKRRRMGRNQEEIAKWRPESAQK